MASARLGARLAEHRKDLRPDVTYSDDALELFPTLLVGMIRAGATFGQCRDEGFRREEIAAVTRLVSLSDREQLDAERGSDVTPANHSGTAATGEAVTALSG